MKVFIVLAVTLACAYGYLSDTPEVASAKVAHFIEKAKAAAAVGAAPDYYTNYYLNYYKSLYNPEPVVLSNGFLADTPEVAAAKSVFLAEHAKAAAATGAIPIASYYNDYFRTLYNPFAIYNPTIYNPNIYNPAQVTVLPNGHLADTPEVAAAKANFQVQYNKALYNNQA